MGFQMSSPVVSGGGGSSLGVLPKMGKGIVTLSVGRSRVSSPWGLGRWAVLPQGRGCPPPGVTSGWGSPPGVSVVKMPIELDSIQHLEISNLSLTAVCYDPQVVELLRLNGQEAILLPHSERRRYNEVALKANQEKETVHSSLCKENGKKLFKDVFQVGEDKQQHHKKVYFTNSFATIYYIYGMEISMKL